LSDNNCISISLLGFSYFWECNLEDDKLEFQLANATFTLAPAEDFGDPLGFYGFGCFGF